ncbi:hypothetical protein LBMAG42_45450 [Deltaproteobacteria bacterium]|nr:hypothetical protein LBMAG42_45450 [Deltaproteobacteria bacterium]
MKLINALRAMPALAALPNDQMEALAYSMIEQNYADGHVFTEEGRGGDSVHLLLEGEVAVSRQDGWVSLGKQAPGVFFGTVALVDDGPRSATCTGVGRTRVATLSSSAFTLLFNTHAPLALAVQEALASQLAADFRRSSARLEAALSGE